MLEGYACMHTHSFSHAENEINPASSARTVAEKLLAAKHVCVFVFLCVFTVTDHFPIHVQTVRDSRDQTGAIDLFPPLFKKRFASTLALSSTNLWLVT